MSLNEHTASPGELDLTVLVTCYNEAPFVVPTIEATLAALEASSCTYEILVIDDNSRDGSEDVIRRYIAEHPDKPVRLHKNVVNQGLANNFIEGAHMGRGKYYRLCCGDNPESAEALTHIFQHVGAADLVIPYQLQHEVQGKAPSRKNISRLFTLLVNLLSGNKILYYNSLPIFLRAHVLRYPPISYGFGFQADIVTRLLDEDITFTQIRHRGSREMKGEGSTALSMRNLLSVLHTFVEIAIRRLRRSLYYQGQPRAREIRLEQ